MKAQEFYDALAERYHLLFEDWWSAAERHGEVVAAVLSSRGVASGRILDATCGVGTQALPLAALGYGVTGADVSAASIARARAEADSRGLAVGLAVHDVRDPGLPTGFDAAISCDNALPHLLTDLDPGRILALKADGTISGGMIPKVETCVAAVDAGVDAAVILDGRIPHAMLLEIFTTQGAGTLVHR